MTELIGDNGHQMNFCADCKFCTAFYVYHSQEISLHCEAKVTSGFRDLIKTGNIVASRGWCCQEIRKVQQLRGELSCSSFEGASEDRRKAMHELLQTEDFVHFENRSKNVIDASLHKMED